MTALDSSCAGLLPLIAPAETAPAIRDDLSDAWLTRADVRAASLALAGKIASERKELVFLFCGANKETVIGLLGAAAAGHAIALVDPSLPSDRLKGLIDAYRPEIVLGARELGETMRAVAPGKAGSLESAAGAIEWISSGAEPTPIEPSLTVLLSTSGTTGSRKYVRLSRDAVAVNARQIAQAVAVDERSVGIAHLPLHYSYGLSIVTSHLMVGGRICLISDSITSPTFWSKIAGAGGTHFPGVPFHYATLARLGLGLAPDSINVFTQAGGALDLRIQTKMHEFAKARGGRFFVMYGQTEASPRMATLAHADFSEHAGSVGLALAGGRLSIVDHKGSSLPAGAVGTVVYEGPNVMLGYAVARPDLGEGDEMKGRLETGDLGRLDQAGFLTLTGRAKRFAKIAGYRLGLDEIEQELTAICPVACLDLGDKIAVAHEREDDAPLKARVRELAANYKVPPSSFVLRRIAQIPRGGSGKTDYARLKEALSV